MNFCQIIAFLACCHFAVRSEVERKQGPVFIYEPPHKVEFLNSTGAVIDCSAHSNPESVVSWIQDVGNDGDTRDVVEIPRLRYTPKNGSLIFPPFSSEVYRQNVHTSVYRCKASNSFGTIVSPPVQVRAAVKQSYQGQVYDEFVIKGNTALFKCQIPSFVRDYVRVSAWIRDDNFVIRTGPSSGSRYSSFENGFLHIRNVMPNDDNMAYWCQTVHRISGETIISSTSGKLEVEEPKSIVQPRISHSEQYVRSKEGSSVELPCAAQGYPVPQYRWMRKTNEKEQTVVTSERIVQLSGSLIIRDVMPSDSGDYICHVNNTVGFQRAQTTLVVFVPYSVYILPQRQRIDVNKRAYLNCTVTGSPVGTVSWYKDGKPLRFDDRVLQPTPTSVIIESVQREDGGMYQCFGSNGLESAQGTSQLYLGDVTPMIIAGFREMTLQPGPAISLSCTGVGNPLPTFRWTLAGRLIRPSNRFRTSQYLTFDRRVVSYLNVSNIKSSEGGEYGCIASNKAGSYRYTNKVHIYGLPYVREMKNKTVISGEDLTARCYVGGYPIESISWKKDGGTIKLSARHKDFKNGTMMIKKTKPVSDDGMYTCTAKNQKGQSAQRSMWIKVLVKPEIAPIAVPPEINIGTRITLMCSVMRGDPPIAKKWLKDGQEIPHQLGVQHTNIRLTSLLEIIDIHSYHDGNYSCIATNQAGSASQTAQIKVQVPPSWIQIPDDKTASLGEDVILDCLAEGHPWPMVEWARIKGGMTVKLVAGTKYELLSNGSLKIIRIGINDEAKYSCRAYNGLEPDLSATMHLNVGAGPKIFSTPSMISVRLGEPAKLECSASGDPPIELSWFKNGRKIDSFGRFKSKIEEAFSKRRKTAIVTVKSTERKDSGVFTCLANNQYGDNGKNISLRITDRPSPPVNVKVTNYFNGSMTLEWDEPIFGGGEPVMSYILQHKKRNGKWSKAKNESTDARKKSYRLTNLKVGTKYELRILAINLIGASEPSKVVRFHPSQNGTLILESNNAHAADSGSTSSTIWLIIPIVISIIAIAIIIIIAIIYFRKRQPNTRLHQNDERKGAVETKQSLMDELQKTQLDRYGRLDANRIQQYSVQKPEYSHYAASTSNPIYSDIEISPYATFHLPEYKNPDTRTNLEMKTFAKKYDIPKTDVEIT